MDISLAEIPVSVVSPSAQTDGRNSRLHRILSQGPWVTLRFSALRLLCLSCLILLINIDINIMTVVICPVVLVHHFASAFGPKGSLPTLLDLLLFFCEWFATILRILLILKEFFDSRRTGLDVTTLSIWVLIIWCIIELTMIFLAFFRISDLVLSSRRFGFWKALWSRYDLAWPIRHKSPYVEKTKSPHKTPYSTKKGCASSVFLGHLYTRYFPGESGWIIYLRAVLAIVLVIAVGVYGILNIVVWPIKESRLKFVRERRSISFPTETSLKEISTWSVIVTMREGRGFIPDLWSAVAVQRLTPEGGNCTLENAESHQIHDELGSYPPFFAAKYTCTKSVSWNPDRSRAPNTNLPDLLVTVNFGFLRLPNNHIGNISRDSVQVFAALDSDVMDVVTMTAPTTLVPGAHLLGMVKMSLRRKFISQSLSYFGFIDRYKTMIVGDMPHVYSDPLASDPSLSLIQRGPNFATIRIATQHDVSEWRVYEDYQNKSVLAGVASVGGLWAFAAGIFVAVFGTSTMRILFGLKPLSIFGMVHWLQTSKLRDACSEEYPKVQQDIAGPPAERGLLALLHDHLLDVNFLSPTEHARQDLKPRETAAVVELQRDGFEVQPLMAVSSARGGKV